MLVSGALHDSRGALFPALKSIGLQDEAVRRAWAAMRYGAWQTATLLATWQTHVAGQGEWQASQYAGYYTKAVDIAAYWRPALKGDQSKHYDAEADKVIPAVVFGMVGRVGRVSPDGRTAVSGSKDGTLILWDLESGEALRRYHGHSGRLNSVDFSPDGRTVLSGADDGVMIEWCIDDTLEELTAWTQANRYLYELTCSERAQYGVEPLCEE